MSSKIERIGIYGGTFSPIHCGHVKAAIAFLKEMQLDKLFIIPTAKPPHKAEVKGATSEDRLNMLKLAFENCEEYKNGKIEISDYEISKEEKSYTVKTLEYFSSHERRLYLLMGTDMFLTLDEWYRAGDIFTLADIVLMRREDKTRYIRETQEKKDEYIRNFGAKIHFISESPIEVSSTEIRQMIVEGKNTLGLIPDGVYKYITENQLYR